MRASNEKRRPAGGCTPARTALSYPLCHDASVQKFKLNLRTADSGAASMSRETPSWRPALTSAVNQHACVGRSQVGYRRRRMNLPLGNPRTMAESMPVLQRRSPFGPPAIRSQRFGIRSPNRLTHSTLVGARRPLS
jgi:hypothetical protein